ncbi:hypothetical protein EW145_g3200 [Phellinidium pouzarii]|uniref:BZIP domain-containing protein n=1 Tax=Phellinidium pouzarii TaxID=167371 RepID=A0A4S4L891_9AGAM|nr:hypothetical protein EW145_g3200 [Phellinidium pouzarii]
MGSSSSPSPTFAQSLISGGVAGTSVDLLFYPLDTVKTRLQSAQGFFNAGGFKGIYKGVGSVVVGSAPGAAVFFSTYDTLKRTFPLRENYASLNHMLSASMAEVAACLIRVPTEVVKSRAQTSHQGPSSQPSLAAARYVLAHDGLAGFYRGFGSTIMREIPFTSLQFPLYELLKMRLARALGRRTLGAHEAAMCGSVAGGVAAAITTPLDVLKTRTMLDLRQMSEKDVPSLAARLRGIYVNEGLKALFAGVVPRTLWISAGGAVFLGAYEWTVQGLTGIAATAGRVAEGRGTACAEHHGEAVERVGERSVFVSRWPVESPRSRCDAMRCDASTVTVLAKQKNKINSMKRLLRAAPQPARSTEILYIYSYIFIGDGCVVRKLSRGNTTGASGLEMARALYKDRPSQLDAPAPSFPQPTTISLSDSPDSLVCGVIGHTYYFSSGTGTSFSTARIRAHSFIFMSRSPSVLYLASEAQPAAYSASSEEQEQEQEHAHIDDVDAQLPRQDVLIPPWASPNRQSTSLQPALRSEAHLSQRPFNSFAIQPVQNNFTNNLGQDVLLQLSRAARPSSVTTTTTSSSLYQNVQSSRHPPLESSLPSDPNQSIRHGSINSSSRLRTSPPVFGTTTKLAAHYGIPTKLPPTPRVNSVNNPKPPVPRFYETNLPANDTSSSFNNPLTDEFQSLLSSYMTMLSTNKADENASARGGVAQSPSTATFGLEPSAEEAAQTIRSMVFGGEFTSPWDEFNEYLTSPLMDDDSPLENLLETPIQDPGLDDFFTSPVVADANSVDQGYPDMPLFSQPASYNDSSIDVSKMTISSVPQNSALLPTPTFEGLLTMSPSTPALDPQSIKTSPLFTDLSEPAGARELMTTTTATRNRVKQPTGTRKNITPEALVPLNAPTQPRSYVLPSSTSRKEVPAVFARKRARYAAFADEEDELADEYEGGASGATPSMTETEAIAAKRRQNTLAARRSRMRKLEYQRQLEEKVETEQREKEMWKKRALMLRSQVMQLGCPEPFREEA